MTIFNFHPVFGLVRGFNLSNGHHDHIVVISIANKLVSTPFNDLLGAFEKFEGRGGIALDEHVTTCRLFCNSRSKEKKSIVEVWIKNQLKTLFVKMNNEKNPEINIGIYTGCSISEKIIVFQALKSALSYNRPHEPS